MLEQDPAKINVQLIHFEKYAPFCMPGVEGTFGNVFVVTWLRTGGRTPFGWGRRRHRSSRVEARTWRLRNGRGFFEIFV
jgi:hypothetical protein